MRFYKQMIADDALDFSLLIIKQENSEENHESEKYTAIFKFTQ